MHHTASIIKHDEHGEAKTLRIVQPLQHYLSQPQLFLTFRLPRVIVHVDIDKAVINDTADSGVIGCKVTSYGEADL